MAIWYIPHIGWPFYKMNKTRKQFHEPGMAARVIEKRRLYKLDNKTNRTYDGHVFYSTRHKERYLELLERWKAGHITIPMMHAIFFLPGGVRYKSDFAYLYYATLSNGSKVISELVIEDIKNIKTKAERDKKALILSEYGIRVVEV